MNANPLLDPFLHRAIREHVQELFDLSQPPRPSMREYVARLRQVLLTIWSEFRRPRPSDEQPTLHRSYRRAGSSGGRS